MINNEGHEVIDGTIAGEPKIVPNKNLSPKNKRIIKRVLLGAVVVAGAAIVARGVAGSKEDGEAPAADTTSN